MRGSRIERSMPSVIVCPACDLAHRRGATEPTERTRCVRCRSPLQRPVNGNIDTGIALAVSALGLLIFSNAYPLVAMNSQGTTRAATLIDATLGFFRQGHPTLALLVLFTTIVGPFVQIGTLLYLLIPLRNGRSAPAQNLLFRLLTHVRPWSLVEVFMLGALVALVRLATFAQVVPGIALWSYGLLMLTLAALTSHTSPEQFWRWAEQSRA
jgi:paraquat-inducible protein A